MSGKRMVLAAAAALAAAVPLQAHHSFAPFDQTKTMVFTGVVTRINPDANHLQIYFAPMNAERKNVERDSKGEAVIWEVEMAGSAAAAQEGVSTSTFPRGTVFSVALSPMRNGDPKGLRRGPIFKCPMGADGKAIPPAAGKHCDTVAGHVTIGQGALPTPTD